MFKKTKRCLKEKAEHLFDLFKFINVVPQSHTQIEWISFLIFVFEFNGIV